MIDQLFNPFFAFLDMGIDKLNSISKVTSQGLDVGQYLSVFGDMPTAWQMAISSLLISCTCLGTIIIFRAIVRLYYAIKEAIPFL